MAYKSVGSALCLQLPHHKKSIQRGGSWQEIRGIMSPITVVRKIRASDYGFGFTSELAG